MSVWLSTGALSHMHVNWLSPIKIRTIVIGGSRRTIVLDDMNPPQRLAVYDRGVDRVPVGSLGPDERRQTLVSYRTGDIWVPALPEREARLHVGHGRVRCGDHGAPVVPTDVSMGLRIIRMLEGASLSAEQDGRGIPVNLAVSANPIK